MRAMAVNPLVNRVRRRLVALRSDGFFRRLALLSGSAAAGQAFLLLCTPILTRLYSPEAFGEFAILYAIVIMIGTVGLFKIEPRLGICPPEEIPVALATCVISACAVLGFVFTTLFLLTNIVRIELPVPLWILVMLPPLGFLQICPLPASYLYVRAANFRKFALQRIARFAGLGTGQLAFGWIMAGRPWALALGLAVGQLSELAVASRVLVPALRNLRAPDFAAVPDYLRRMWRYPLYTLPSRILSDVLHALPVFVAASLYGPYEAGLVAIAQRLLFAPTRLLGHNASHVIMGSKSEKDSVVFYRVISQYVKYLVFLAGLGFIILYFITDEMWAYILGENWHGIRIVLIALMPLYASYLVLESLSSLHIMLDMQGTMLVRFVILGLCGIFTAFVAYELNLEFDIFLSIYAFCGMMVCAVFLLLVLRRAKTAYVNETSP